MDLTTSTDIAAPHDHVFARASDFDAFARRAVDQGAQVARRDAGPVAVGSTWDITLDTQGKARRLICTLDALDPCDGYRITSTTDGLVIVTRVTFAALSPQTTRATVDIAVSARTLAARLLLQGLRLARPRLAAGLDARVGRIAAQIAET